MNFFLKKKHGIKSRMISCVFGALRDARDPAQASGRVWRGARVPVEQLKHNRVTLQ